VRYPRLGRSVWPTSRAYRDRVGLVRRYEVTPDTVALWQFDGDLTDSGPNGLHLSGAEAHYVQLSPELRGLRLCPDLSSGSGSMQVTIQPEDGAGDLGLLGDVTLDMLLLRTAFYGYTNPPTIAAFGDAELSYSAKCPWLFASTSYVTAFGHGHGVTAEKTVSTNTIIDRGGLMSIKCTRDATARTIQIYCNGRKIADGSYTTDPDRNDLQRFYLGGSTSPLACLCSVRVEGAHHDFDRALADYHHTLGQYYGEPLP